MPTSGNTTSYEWWIVNKVYQSGTLGTPHEVVETAIMRRRNGADLNFAAEYSTMLSEGAVPGPDALYGSSTGTYLDHLRCRSVTAEKVDSAHIKITVRYTGLYSDDGPGVLTPKAWLPASTEYTARVRPMQAWRRSWTVNPSNVDESAEIGGTNINTNGEPVIQEVPQLSFRVRLTLDASVTGMINAVQPNVDLLGRLNNDTFYGFVAGTVLCEGITATKLDIGTEYYEVIIDFLYDKFFHMSQVADCDIDGRVIPTTAASPGKGAKTVKWKRISRTNGAFNSVFSDNAYKDLAQKGWWPPL